MSVKDLLKELSVESLDRIVEEPLEECTLAFGKSASKHFDDVSKVDSKKVQLSELKEHLDDATDPVSLEVYQMNYRHIMESSGLGTEVVTFESRDPFMVRDYLSLEVAKSIAQLDALSEQMTDFSPESKIWSFLRRDKAKINAAMIALNKVSDPALKDIAKKAVHRHYFKFLIRNDRPIQDLEAEIRKDVGLVVDADREVTDRLTKLRDLLKSGKPFNSHTPNRIKILDENLLGNRNITERLADSKIGVVRTVVAGGLAWLTGKKAVATLGLVLKVHPVSAVVSAAVLYFMFSLTKGVATKKDDIVITFGKMANIKLELDRLVTALNQDRNQSLVVEIQALLKSYEGFDKDDFKSALKALVNLDSLLYEHAFFLVNQTRGIAESM